VYGLKRPAGQLEQGDGVLGDAAKVPTPHAVHPVEPGADTNPAEHVEHDEEPLDAENCPPGHCGHAFGVPGAGAYVPAVQIVQFKAPACEKKPIGHCWHAICVGKQKRMGNSTTNKNASSEVTEVAL
jgi:hypothetical protein